jgi:hypothetical protein
MVGSEKANVLPIRPYIFKKSLDFIKNPSHFEPFKAFPSPPSKIRRLRIFSNHNAGHCSAGTFFSSSPKKRRVGSEEAKDCESAKRREVI